MSVPLVSVQTMRVSGGTRSEYALSCVKETLQVCRTLLLLISFIFPDSRVQQTATLFIFRLDVYPGHVLTADDQSAEALLQNQRDRHEKMRSIDANNRNTEITEKRLHQRRDEKLWQPVARAAAWRISMSDSDGVRKAYLDNRARTKARSAIKPVIIS